MKKLKLEYSRHNSIQLGLKVSEYIFFKRARGPDKKSWWAGSGLRAVVWGPLIYTVAAYYHLAVLPQLIELHLIERNLIKTTFDGNNI